MKIPNEVIGRTQSSGQPLGYLQDSSGLAARGWQEAAAAIQGLGKTVEQHQLENDRFDAMTGMADLEQKYTLTQSELDRTADPNDPTYLQRSELTFDNYSRDFLAKLPPSIRPEFEARIADMKGKAFDNSLKFKYGLDELRYRDGIGKVYEKAKVDLYANYSDEALKSSLATIYQSIEASNLLPDAKQKLKLDLTESLAAVGYRKRLEKEGATGPEPKAVYGGGKKIPVEGVFGKQLAFVVHELNGTESKANARLKSATTLAEAVEAGIAYERPANTPGALARTNRLNNAKKVINGKAPPRAMAAYAYLMKQGYTQVQAAGFVGSLMQESGQNLNPDSINRNDAGPGRHSIGIGQWNRERLKALEAFGGTAGTEVDAPPVGGYAEPPSVDKDSLFDGLPLEKRLAIRDSWDVDRRQADALNAKDAKEKYDSWFNQLKTDVYNGTVDMSDLETMLNEGKFQDFEHFIQAKAVFDARKEKVTTLGEAKDALSSGLPLTGEMADALMKDEGGYAKLAKGDMAYATTLNRRVGGMGPLARGLLGNMLLQNDDNKALFAMRALLDLKNSGNETQFDLLPDKIQSMVSQFGTLSGTMNDNELIKRIRGGDSADPAVRQQMEQFRITADKTFDDKDYGPKKAANALNSFLAPWMDSNSTLTNVPYARAAFNEWYREAWKLNYQKFLGDQSAATAATNAEIPNNWGVTVVGLKTFMRAPPERLGLPAYMTPVDLDKQARAQLAASGYKDLKTYQLIDDRRTLGEVEGWRAAGNKAEGGWRSTIGSMINGVFKTEIPVAPLAPSYGVLVQSSDGMWRQIPTRIRFSDEPALRTRELNLMTVTGIDAKIDGIKEQLQLEKGLENERTRGASDTNSMTKMLEQQLEELNKQKDEAVSRLPKRGPLTVPSVRGGSTVITPQKEKPPAPAVNAPPPSASFLKDYPDLRLPKLTPEAMADERKQHLGETDYQIRLRIYRDWVAPGENQ